MDTNELHPATKVVRAGIPAAEQGQPLLPGPTFASIYHVAGDPDRSPQTYGRHDNPTWMAFEAALEALEGGPATVFASGMAAVNAVFGTVLRPGDTLLMPSDSYFSARQFAGEYLRELGIHVASYETAHLSRERLENVRLLWVETPSNPGLDVCDIAAAAAAAHDAGALLAVDNTTPTPLGQSPLALGADFSVASDTKAMAGHGDLLLGHVACRSADEADKIRAWRTYGGAIPGPMEVWLAHRSIATLELRLARMSDNALAIASMLAAREDVGGVRYPGLPADPAHDIARKQMRFYGPVVSFTLESAERAQRFLSACRLVTEATSFGGVHSSAERRARWGGDAVAPGFIRFSAGCEYGDDLVADVAQALDASRG